MKKFLSAVLTACMLTVLVTGCGSSTGTGTTSQGDGSQAQNSQAAVDEKGTHKVTDQAGNTVEVPNKITRVVIDQIPILSTYMSYFKGSAPYIVGYCGSFKDTITKTVLKDIAPELMKSSDTVYAQSDLNIEEIMKLNPDVILYNANNASHAQILKESGIPSIGFATVGASTDADPIDRYQQWLELLEDVFNEDGKMNDFKSAGNAIVADVEKRIAAVPQDKRPSAMILWKYSDGVPQVSGNGTFGTFWLKRLGVKDVVVDEAKGFTQVNMEQVYRYDTTLGMWNWFTPNPDAPLVYAWLACKTYPEVFADYPLEQTIKDYYQKWYGYTVTDADMAEMLQY